MPRRILAAALALCLLLCGCGSPAAANETSEYIEAPAVQSPRPSPVKTERLPDIRIYHDGLLSARGCVVDGEAFVPVSLLMKLCGIDPEISFDGTELKMSCDSFYFEASLGSGYISANYRYFYSSQGFIVNGDEIYFPPDVAEWIFGIDISVSEEKGRIDVDTSSLSLIKGWPSYYDDTYTFADVYWLSHIITAEARNQPLEGKIGVGNVVLNRLHSPLYPSTVYDVIFDSEHAIQFEPTMNGAITKEPDEESYAAAYLALEGCNTVGDSLYFLNPKLGSDVWLKEKKQFVITIADHDFYAEKGA